MARSLLVVLAVSVIASAMCKPLEGFDGNDLDHSPRPQSTQPRLWKRFINPTLGEGGFADFSPETKMRIKRSSEDCEKLQLCKLHARSGHSFLASFQLYFVSKENAKLWDHQAHSMADCERRYSGCRHAPAPAPAPGDRAPQERRQYQFIDYDYE